jgi:hypothetical protein
MIAMYAGKLSRWLSMKLNMRVFFMAKQELIKVKVETFRWN